MRGNAPPVDVSSRRRISCTDTYEENVISESVSHHPSTTWRSGWLNTSEVQRDPPVAISMDPTGLLRSYRPTLMRQVVDSFNFKMPKGGRSTSRNPSIVWAAVIQDRG